MRSLTEGRVYVSSFFRSISPPTHPETFTPGSRSAQHMTWCFTSTFCNEATRQTHILFLHFQISFRFRLHLLRWILDNRHMNRVAVVRLGAHDLALSCRIVDTLMLIYLWILDYKHQCFRLCGAFITTCTVVHGAERKHEGAAGWMKGHVWEDVVTSSGFIIFNEETGTEDRAAFSRYFWTPTLCSCTSSNGARGFQSLFIDNCTGWRQISHSERCISLVD